MQIAETFYVAFTFISSVVLGLLLLFWICDMLISIKCIRVASIEQLPFLLFGFLGSLLLFISWNTARTPETKTEYFIENLVIQEFDSNIEYRTYDGTVIYTLSDIKEFKQRQNISGFIKIERSGWGPDSKETKPVYKSEETK